MAEPETVAVLAVGAHPDDVELGAGGTIATLVAQGHSVALLHLTRGEAGTRGDEATRRREAERAAEILGAASLEFLDCGDGGLRHGVEEEDAVIEVLRRRRPEIVLAPPPADRHPDHGRAFQLVRDACYFAGLRGREVAGSASPHRPGLLLSYMLHDSFEPDLIVDVTARWETKLEALAAYESQLHSPTGARTDDPETKIGSERFHAAVVGRARHWGLLVGADYGEPLLCHGPMRAGDLLALVPPGPR
jgi:bacillithiol biosynthesis deacetylase BshB1